MANTIYSQGDKVEYGIKVFVVDTEEDKSNLPIRSAKMGSKCYVIGTKKWYILNGSFGWDPFVDAGGSGGSPFVPKGSVATVDELPTEDNAIGDLYIVQEDHSEWVWLTSTEEPDGYWEQIGSAILPSDIVEATEQMTNEQATETRENLRAEPKKVDVTFTESNSNWSCDKTFQQISDAYTANKIVQYYIDRTGYTPTISTDASVKNNEITVTFLFSSLDMPVVYIFILSSNDSITFFASPLKDNKQTVSGTTPTITPVPNNIYECGTLTSLTISNPPATGSYSIVFTSGSTATTTTFPATILGLEDFAAEANTMYEINVLDNRAVVSSWAVTV